MADETAPSTLPEELRDLIVTRLRQDHPWMKIDAVHAAATAHADLLATQLEKQFNQTEASKARCSFMSLPPEIRVCIDELALTPEQDGDGGEPDTRAIAVGVNSHGPRDDPDYNWPLMQQNLWAQQPALTKISRSIRQESLPVYYGVNHFVACSGFSMRWGRENTGPYIYEIIDVDLSATEVWLKAIGPDNTALIKNLEICHDISESCTYLPDYDAFIGGLEKLLKRMASTLPSLTRHLCLRRDEDYTEWWRPLCLADEQPSTSVDQLPCRGSLAYRMAR